MKRHPSELFIKSLLARKLNTDKIIQTLSEFGLPSIPDEYADDYLDALDKAMGAPPAPLHDEASHAWLREQQIYFLIHPDSVVAACTRLLDNNAVKRDVYVSLIGRVTSEDLSSHLQMIYDVDVSSETLRAFRHYYFDVDRMSVDDWAYVLQSMPGSDESYYESALNGGATVAAYRLGRELNISIRDAVKEAVTGLYVSLHEIRHWPASPSKVKVLSDTVGALAKAHNVISTADAELASVAHELRQFKLARNDTKPAALNALTGGRHSGSGKKDAS